MFLHPLRWPLAFIFEPRRRLLQLVHVVGVAAGLRGNQLDLVRLVEEPPACLWVTGQLLPLLRSQPASKHLLGAKLQSLVTKFALHQKSQQVLVDCAPQNTSLMSFTCRRAWTSRRRTSFTDVAVTLHSHSLINVFAMQTIDATDCVYTGTHAPTGKTALACSTVPSPGPTNY